MNRTLAIVLLSVLGAIIVGFFSYWVYLQINEPDAYGTYSDTQISGDFRVTADLQYVVDANSKRVTVAGDYKIGDHKYGVDATGKVTYIF